MQNKTEFTQVIGKQAVEFWLDKLPNAKFDYKKYFVDKHKEYTAKNVAVWMTINIGLSFVTYKADNCKQKIADIIKNVQTFYDKFCKYNWENAEGNDYMQWILNSAFDYILNSNEEQLLEYLSEEVKVLYYDEKNFRERIKAKRDARAKAKK